MQESLLEVLAAFGYRRDREELDARRPSSGLIHDTTIVSFPEGERLVVQRLHPLFSEAVLEDMDAVTAHLAQCGLETPRLLATSSGLLGVRDGDGRLWRILTCLDGRTIDRIERPAQAAAAAALVARFHEATRSFVRPFAFVRAGAHDTRAHLGRLASTVASCAARDRDGRVPLAEAILQEAHRRPELPDTPRRVTHGDLKISNVLYRREDDVARALLDLDTVGHLPIAYELGDAWRSWCNPAGEDTEHTAFDLATLTAAAAGYARAGPGLLTADEVQSLVPGIITVALELAARFCVDAFEDRYFGWDPARFPSRVVHNRVRAIGQLDLARKLTRIRGAAEACVAHAFAVSA